MHSAPAPLEPPPQDRAQLAEEIERLKASLTLAHQELAAANQAAAETLARQQRVEAHLRAQEALLRTVVDESPDVIVLKDHQGNFLLCNRVVAQLYGTTPEAMVGKHDGDFSATPEQAEFFRQNVLGIMARGQTEVVFEESTDGATGEVRWFKSIKKPFIGGDGLPQILVIAHDISDIRQAEKQVAESEKRLRYVLDATGEGVWDWHLPSDTLAHNQRWYDLLGYTGAEMSGTVQDFLRSVHPEDMAGVMAAVQDTLEGRGPYRHLHRMVRRDGSAIWVFDRGDVVERDADGKALRMVGSFADVTERREAEVKLERINAQLEQLVAERTRELRDANASLSDTLQRLRTTQQELVEREKQAALGEMVAGVAHEVNTPIGVAVTASTLWQDRSRELRKLFEQGAMKRSDLQAYLDSSDQLGEVVAANLARAAELVRSFKQVAVRHASGAVENFSLVEALEAAVASLAPEWRRNQLRVAVMGDRGVRMLAAPDFVFHVVSNLVLNATRHAFAEGAGGDVELSVERQDQFACLRYRDNGVGMEPEVLARIFEPFFTTRRGSGGSGLGLHIVWNLVISQLKGRIETFSKPGEGLTMNLYLPCLPPEGP